MKMKIIEEFIFQTHIYEAYEIEPWKLFLIFYIEDHCYGISVEKVLKREFHLNMLRRINVEIIYSHAWEGITAYD
jgi:hypothetical protein